MKKWIQRDFGRPGYQYIKMVDGKKVKKPFDFRIPCVYGDLNFCTVSAFNLLSLIQTAEEFYGTELKNIQLVMHCVPERGHGEDREAAYVQYYITFEKLETDEEMALREKREQEEDDRENKKKLELEQKEKELLLTYLKKYGDIREELK